MYFLIPADSLKKRSILICPKAYLFFLARSLDLTSEKKLCLENLALILYIPNRLTYSIIKFGLILPCYSVLLELKCGFHSTVCKIP